METKKLYITIMNRWGNSENYSYPLGVYDDKEKAISEGLKEFDSRGGKYMADVFEVNLNESKKRKTIMEANRGKPEPIHTTKGATASEIRKTLGITPELMEDTRKFLEKMRGCGNLE